MVFGLAAFEVFGLLFMPDSNDEGVHDRGLVACSANPADPSDGCFFARRTSRTSGSVATSGS
jgi:hypothetical protein